MDDLGGVDGVSFRMLYVVYYSNPRAYHWYSLRMMPPISTIIQLLGVNLVKFICVGLLIKYLKIGISNVCKSTINNNILFTK